MYFSKALAAVAATALFASANAGIIQARAMTADVIVTNIMAITTQSQNLQGPASSINDLSGVSFVLGQGPAFELVQGFEGIITTVQTDISGMTGTPKITDVTAQNKIFDAFREFVTIHQELLKIVIGKDGLLSEVFFGPPLAAALRTLEGVVDQIANGLINLAETVANDLETQAGLLDATIKDAINAYST